MGTSLDVMNRFYNQSQVPLKVVMTVTDDDDVEMFRLLGAISIVGGFYLVIYGQRIERRRKRAALEAAMMEPSLVKVDIGTDEKLIDLKHPLLS